MSIEIQYGTIKAWPGTLRTRGERVRALFKSGHTETLRMLERELRMVGAEAPVVQLAMSHFNRNGLPYSDAVPEHPGVLVSFVKPIRNPSGQLLKRVPLRFAADRFLTWESNLRAIAIGLEDLRRVERYGITSGSEQYLGFRALPPPGPDHEDILTVEDAARFIYGHANAIMPSLFSGAGIIKESVRYRDAYRIVAAKLHPDSPGMFIASAWAKLQAAKTLLDAHHGI